MGFSREKILSLYTWINIYILFFFFVFGFLSLKCKLIGLKASGDVSTNSKLFHMDSCSRAREKLFSVAAFFVDSSMSVRMMYIF